MKDQLDKIADDVQGMMNDVEETLVVAENKRLMPSDVPQLELSVQSFIVLEFLKLVKIFCPGEYIIGSGGFTRCRGKTCPTCKGVKRITFQDIFSVMAEAHLNNTSHLSGGMKLSDVKLS